MPKSGIKKDSGQALNKKIISENFSRAAKNYDQLASVQKQAAEKLCQLASPFLKENFKILDLGSGTGFIANNLNREKNLQIFQTDLSLDMLKQNIHKYKIICDFENLPFKNISFDILISSFSLQWLTDFNKNFSEFFSLLKPNGIFAFCLPTKESLKELKTASKATDCEFNFNILPEVNYLKSALKNSGFEEKLFQQEIIKSEFPNGFEALKSIKDTGANYFLKKNFVSKTQLRQFNSFCLKNFSNDHKNIFISWETSFFIFQKSAQHDR
jgi:malonyl-CoA O-methyltransferase